MILLEAGSSMDLRDLEHAMEMVKKDCGHYSLVETGLHVAGTLAVHGNSPHARHPTGR